MAESKDTVETQEQSPPTQEAEPRLRWGKREEPRGGRQAGQQMDGGSPLGNTSLSDEQRALVDHVVLEAVAAEQAKTEDANQKFLRVQADFSNFKRRSESEREQQARFGTQLLVGELLPVLDNFERALTTIPEEVGALPWTDGLRLIDRQLRGTLEKQGLKAIEAVGAKFDPAQHEAIISEESPDHADDEVIAELRRGYMLHDRVVRPTLVKVAKNVAQPTQR